VSSGIETVRGMVENGSSGTPPVEEDRNFERALNIEEENIEIGRAEADRLALTSGRAEGYELGLKAGLVIGSELSFHRGLAYALISINANGVSARAKKTAQSLANDSEKGISRDDPEVSRAAVRSKARLLSQQLGWEDVALTFPVKDKPMASSSMAF